MAEAQEANGGVILRSDDGSLYFIRDEMLELCKTEGVYRERVEEATSGNAEVEGFALNAYMTYETLGSVRLVAPASPGLDPGSIAMKTAMCPW
jgi:hypothetical protein